MEKGEAADVIARLKEYSLFQFVFRSTGRQLSGSNDDIPVVESTETAQLVNTIFINFILFIGMVVLFELVRRKKSIFACRCMKKLSDATPLRVPARPSNVPFSWVYNIMQVSTHMKDCGSMS